MKKKQFATKKVLAVITAASMAASPTAVYAAETESQVEQEVFGVAEIPEALAATEMSVEETPIKEASVEGETLGEISTESTTGEVTDSVTENLNQENILTDGNISAEENNSVEQPPAENQMSSAEEALHEKESEEELLISDGTQAEETEPLADVIQNGWVQEGDNWCYYQNGEKLTNQEIHEYEEETGETVVYRVDETGNRMSSCWYNDETGNTFYYKEDGKRASGFTEIDGNRYYFEVNNGFMYKDKVDSIYDEKTDKSYYYRFNADGTIYTGWYKDGEEEWSTVYYYYEDGRSAEGLTEIDGDTYYFDDGGWIYKNYIHIIDGRFYYFGSDGKATVNQDVTSDKWVEAEGFWYYVRNQELIKDEFLTLDDHTYYLNYEGRMIADEECYIYDSEMQCEYRYRFDADGHMVTGWYKDGEEEWANTYYYHENGHKAENLTEIAGKIYYFGDYNNSMTKSRMVEIDGTAYYFGADGALESKKDLSEDGWFQAGNNWYYAKDGVLVTNQFLKAGKYTYYFEYDGRMVANTEYSIYDSETERSYEYRFDKEGHMVTGWYKDGEEEWSSVYYYHENGRKAEGLTEIAGKKYYFNDYMYKNTMVELDGKVYYFGEDGVLVSEKDLSSDGWFYAGECWYYIKEGVLIKNQLLKIGKYTYYFEYDGCMIANAEYSIYDSETDKSYTYRFDKDGHMVTGWYKDGEEEWSNTYYYHENGRKAEGLTEIVGKIYYFGDYSNAMVKSRMVELDGTAYYFGKDGTLESKKDLSSKGWFYAGENWYYAKDGALVKNQFLKIGEYTYYFYYDGNMAKDGWNSIYDSETDEWYTYHFDKDGHMITGWYKDGEEEWASVYYYYENGRQAEGLTEIAGKTYYFNDSMYKNAMVELDGTAYYFGKDGTLESKRDLSVSGWFYAGENWYYIKDGGIVTEQFLKIGKYTYYFEHNGYMYADGGYSIYDSETDEWYTYRFDKDGHMITGWYKDGEEEWSSVYYYHENGRQAEGLTEIAGKTYYFDDYMYRNAVAEIAGTAYYFGADGVLESKRDISVNGWFYAGENWYYAKDGALVRNQFLKIGNYTYYFYSDGNMAKDGWNSIYDSETDEWYTYRFDKDGHMITGWYKVGYNWFYYNNNGRAAEGVQNVNGVTYYFSEGRMLTDCSATLDGILYYFGENGNAVKQINLQTDGWKQMPDGWYYAKNGELLRNEWINSGSKRYYLHSNGKMAANEIVEIFEDDSYYTYRFDKNGWLVTGWYQEEDDSWYYYDKDGRVLGGVQTVGGSKYYFDTDGLMMTEISAVFDGILYYFGASGKAEKQINLQTDGWKQMPDGWYYSENGEVLHDKLLERNGYTYYIDRNGKMAVDREIGFTDNDGNSYWRRFDNNGYMVRGWYRDSELNWFYYDEEGRNAEGLREINGLKYYFDSSGRMLTDCSREIGGVLYYFGKNGNAVKQINLQTDGWKQTPNGWYYVKNGNILRDEMITVNGYTYYLGYDGSMATNTIYTHEENGDTYRFDSYGHMVKGWYESYGTWYYYDANGRAAEGIVEINGAKYYFGEDGQMKVYTALEEDGMLYYFGKSGKLEKAESLKADGWKQMPNGRYYAKSGKIVRNQWINRDNFYYYFDADGIMYADRTVSITENGKGNVYHFNKNGQMITGWIQEPSGGWRYYGKDGRAPEGMVTIAGKMYYFSDKWSYMSVNRHVYYDGKVYIADGSGVCTPVSNGWKGADYYIENGKAVTGWKMISNKWYYFNPETGRKYSNGVATIGNKEYYFDSNGAMRTGWIMSQEETWMFADANGVLAKNWAEISGKRYYFNEEHEYITGIYKINGKYHLFDKNGIWQKEIGYRDNGWMTVGAERYYFQNGQMIKGTAKVIGGKRYRFGFDGRMTKNATDGEFYYGSDGAAVISTWKKAGVSGWVYYDENGRKVSSGWKKINNAWYYFIDDKVVQTDSVIDGKLYHFSGSGESDGIGTVLVKGWNLIDGQYYYYRNNDILKSQWATIGTERYYFDDKGQMAFLRFIFNGDNRHYLNKSGQISKGWFQVSDDYYSGGKCYADANGIVVEGLQTISGKQYYFEDSGRLCMTDTLSRDKKTMYEIKNGVVVNQVKASGTGWKKSVNGNWFYSKNGIFATGHQIINGHQYYFDQITGAMITNSPAYFGYAGADGVLKFNGWYNDLYYVDGTVQYGAQTIGDKYYYFHGGISAKGLYYADGAYYSYDGKGGRSKVTLKNGWNLAEGNWYYVSEGKLVKTTREIDGVVYYFDSSDGHMRTNTFIQDSYKGEYPRMYVDANGRIVRGWKLIEGSWYYFDTNGRAVTGTHKINGVTYIFDNAGIMQN